MLLENKTLLLTRNYEVKEIICPIGFEYKNIHVCLDDCVLYIDEFVVMKVCPTCE